MKRYMLFLTGLLCLCLLALPTLAQDTPVPTDEPVATQEVIIIITPTPEFSPTPETPEPETTPMVIIIEQPPVDPPIIIIPPPAPASDSGSINFAYIFGSIALFLLAFQTYRSTGRFKPEEIQAIIERERANAVITTTPLDNLAVDIGEAIAGVLFRFQPGQPIPAAGSGKVRSLAGASTAELMAEIEHRQTEPIAPDTSQTAG